MKKLLVVLLGVLLLLPFSASAADLKYGMKNNEEVRQVQQYLKDGGYYKGDVTGNFYSVTLAAVKKFQKENKLKVTGIWNQLSQDKKDELLAIHNDVYEQIAEVSHIPIGWIANGDGTFSPPPTVAPVSVSVWTPPAQIVYGTAPVQNPTVKNQFETPIQPVQVVKKEEAKDPIPVAVNNSVNSTSIGVTTSTPSTITVNPTSVTLIGNINNFGNIRDLKYNFYPFYYYVNCDPLKNDNAFSIDPTKVNSNLNEHKVITMENGSIAVVDFTINDLKPFNNQSWVNNVVNSPDFISMLNKSPDLKSITLTNDGNIDLTKVNLRLKINEPFLEQNSDGTYRVLYNSSRMFPLPLPIISSTNVTKNSVTFTFDKPVKMSYGAAFSDFSVIMDTTKLKKNDTYKFSVTGSQIINNDASKNYTLTSPLIDEYNQVVTKCDVVEGAR